MLAEDEFCGIVLLEVCGWGGVGVVEDDELAVLAGVDHVVVEVS